MVRWQFVIDLQVSALISVIQISNWKRQIIINDTINTNGQLQILGSNYRQDIRKTCQAEIKSGYHRFIGLAVKVAPSTIMVSSMEPWCGVANHQVGNS